MGFVSIGYLFIIIGNDAKKKVRNFFHHQNAN